jgi:hypothetical protein
MRIILGLTAAFSLILSASALAESEEERSSCFSDAFRVCGAAIPDRDRVFACLLERRAQLSPGCRGVMNRHAAENASRGRKQIPSRQRADNTPTGGINAR